MELNVLDDILGEPAHDEFAAELDKASKGTNNTVKVLCTYLGILSNSCNKGNELFLKMK